MTKKKWRLVVVACVLLLSVVLFYRFYFSKPDSFPENNQLVQAINSLNPEAEADIIQDTIMLDEQHAFVPFITEKGNRGMSLWLWEKHRWVVSYINTAGEPYLWKIDELDRSSYHFVWNMSFDESIQHMKFFLIRDRSFQVSGDIEDYSPGVQMEKRVDISKKSYGVVQVPTDWVSVMDSYSAFVSPEKSALFDSIFPDHLMLFAWNAYDSTDNVSYVGLQSGGSSFSNGHEHIEFVRFLDEMEME